MARTKDRSRQVKEDKMPVFHTATYARLSIDSCFTESDSIKSQQMLMRDFIRGRSEFLLIREYKDDGVSGTRFDRQAFDSLLSEVRKGNINCVIVKDFSRFGRDHVEVGNYLEKVFPFLGVRFISVCDGYDSFDRDSADKKLAVILKNLVNEYVAKDTSIKVASSYITKQENGEYDGGYAPYGYRFADKRKTRFLIDEKPAGVVRDIFSWIMQGDSYAAIVKRLTERNINQPRNYHDTGDFYRNEGERRYWNETTVKSIAGNMAYAGHMALHKHKESKADGIRPHALEPSEWIVTRNTHEAIIPEDDFLLVQEILKARKERYENRCGKDETVIRPENLLKGKVFCGECKALASRMGANYQRTYGKIRIYRYRCRTYREKGSKECSSKSISEKELEGLVYQAVMGFMQNVELLKEILSRFNGEFYRKMRGSMEKERCMAERAIRQGKNEKIRLYREYTSSREAGSSDKKEWYLKEKQKQEDEIRYHEKRIEQLKERTAFFERMEKEQEGWIREVLSCKDAFTGEGESRLTKQMADVFVYKIFLYDGKRVEIVLNFKDEYQTLSRIASQLIDESLPADMEQALRAEEGRAVNG